MTERRYSEEEVAAIFERATETKPVGQRSPSTGSGMTLAELQEIGREVGISPDAIVRAARSVDLPAPASPRRFFGLPIGVGTSVDLGRRLTEAEWERLVIDLRETFDARGHVRSDGSFRQWTNGNLQALLEPTPTGHRLRLRTMKGSARRLMTTGAAALGIAAATFLATTLTGGTNPGSLGGVGFMAMVGLGMFGAGALQLPAWARQRLSQMQGIVSRLTTSSATPDSRALPGGEESS